MTSEASAQVERALDVLFNFSAETGTVDVENHQLASCPITFHDRHCDPTLSLKHIRPFSLLPTHLAESVTPYVEAYKKDYGSFPTNSPRNLSPFVADTNIDNAHDVERAYGPGRASALASTIKLHPGWRQWDSVLRWFKAFQDRQHISNGFLEERYSLVFNKSSIPPHHFFNSGDLIKFIETQGRIELTDFSLRCPALLTMELLIPNRHGERLLKNLSQCFTEDFKWRTAGTTASNRFSPRMALSRPPDGLPAYLDLKSLPKGTSTLRRSQRLTTSSTMNSQKRKSTELPPGDWVIPPKRAKKSKYKVDPADFIQHVWANAVLADTTFIVITSGTVERIAIRHRESQTLYMSDVFDPRTRNEGHAYGKIHSGLSLTAVSDALRRVEIQKKRESQRKSDRKRRLSEVDVPESELGRKRRKPGSAEGREPESSISDSTTTLKPSDNKIPTSEVYNPQVALLYLRDGVHNSGTPSFFVRTSSEALHDDESSQQYYKPLAALSKDKFASTDCLNISVGPVIGTGATGVVHRASLQLGGTSESTFNLDVVVKFGFRKEEKERIAHEYAAYDHLQVQGVTGVIPPCFGLFEDYEGGPIALILGFQGTALTKQDRFIHPENKMDGQVKMGEVVVPSPFREQFMQALRVIHGAGIRHRDIRGANLLSDEEDRCCIIDFDHAILEYNSNRFAEEKSRLIMTLDGDLGSQEMDD